VKRRLALTVVFFAAVAVLWAQTPPVRGALPVLVQTALGRFEVVSIDANAAHAAAGQAEEAWHHLSGPLGLPSAFPSAILVRLVPAADWGETAPFRVIVESGGVVSVRVRWSEATPEIFLRRALVQALLMRLGVAQQGVNEKLTAPLWLEQACVGWWRTHADLAQLDALVQQSAGLTPPDIASILTWQRSDVEPQALAIGSVWLLTWLQSESGRGGEWPALRARLLRGDEPIGALAACFSGRFAREDERELWWQTGWYYLQRQRILPQLGAAESRALLSDAARFVFELGGRDTVLPLRFALRRWSEPGVAVELTAHAAEVERAVAALHPFYRNAGISLLEALRSRAENDAAGEAFEQDWREATALEKTTNEALDALVRRR